MSERMLGRDEVAQRFGVSTRTVDRWVRDRRLPAWRTLRYGWLRVRESDVQRLLGDQR